MRLLCTVFFVKMTELFYCWMRYLFLVKVYYDDLIKGTHIQTALLSFTFTHVFIHIYLAEYYAFTIHLNWKYTYVLYLYIVEMKAWTLRSMSPLICFGCVVKCLQGYRRYYKFQWKCVTSQLMLEINWALDVTR